MARPGSDGPLRSVIASIPPERSRDATFRNALGRSLGATCCHTALRTTASAATPSRISLPSDGRRSSSQVTLASG